MNIQFFFFLYAVCARILALNRFLTILWDLIKIEFYYIAGKCQHSGLCCKGLSLVIDGQRIDTLAQFDVVINRKPEYRRFEPCLDCAGTIDRFHCRCLDQNNRCTDYLQRPKICRDYPDSVFLQHDYIPATCGYYVAQRKFRFQLWIPSSVVHRIALMNSMNNISS